MPVTPSAAAPVSDRTTARDPDGEFFTMLGPSGPAEHQVVRQNLDTTSADALSARGRHVTIGWRDGQTSAVAAFDQEGT